MPLMFGKLAQGKVQCHYAERDTGARRLSD
jgi:hypothetical protein